MITFLVIIGILLIVALIIGFVVLLVLATAGVAGGILIYIFGDLIIGIVLMVLLFKFIFKRRRR